MRARGGDLPRSGGLSKVRRDRGRGLGRGELPDTGRGRRPRRSLVMLATGNMRAQASGVQLTEAFALVVTLKGGRAIRLQEYYDHGKALESVGLPAAPQVLGRAVQHHHGNRPPRPRAAGSRRSPRSSPRPRPRAARAPGPRPRGPRSRRTGRAAPGRTRAGWRAGCGARPGAWRRPPSRRSGRCARRRPGTGAGSAAARRSSPRRSRAARPAGRSRCSPGRAVSGSSTRSTGIATLRKYQPPAFDRAKFSRGRSYHRMMPSAVGHGCAAYCHG